jgi:hypothetical protein
MSQQPHFGHTRHGGLPVHMHVHDHLPHGTVITRFNSRLALLTTRVVGTVWCAYVFAAFDCLALPTALHQGLYGVVQWVASFFLQLVLLSIILVGQNLQATASDARAAKTFEDIEEVRSGMILALDRLDITTEGGLAEVVSRLDSLEAKIGPLA